MAFFQLTLVCRLTLATPHELDSMKHQQQWWKETAALHCLTTDFAACASRTKTLLVQLIVLYVLSSVGVLRCQVSAWRTRLRV